MAFPFKRRKIDDDSAAITRQHVALQHPHKQDMVTSSISDTDAPPVALAPESLPRVDEVHMRVQLSRTKRRTHIAGPNHHQPHRKRQVDASGNINVALGILPGSGVSAAVNVGVNAITTSASSASSSASSSSSSSAASTPSSSSSAASTSSAAPASSAGVVVVVPGVVTASLSVSAALTISAPATLPAADNDGGATATSSIPTITSATPSAAVTLSLGVGAGAGLVSDSVRVTETASIPLVATIARTNLIILPSDQQTVTAANAPASAPATATAATDSPLPAAAASTASALTITADGNVSVIVAIASAASDSTPATGASATVTGTGAATQPASLPTVIAGTVTAINANAAANATTGTTALNSESPPATTGATATALGSSTLVRNGTTLVVPDSSRTSIPVTITGTQSFSAISTNSGVIFGVLTTTLANGSTATLQLSASPTVVTLQDGSSTTEFVGFAAPTDDADFATTTGSSNGSGVNGGSGSGTSGSNGNSTANASGDSAAAPTTMPPPQVLAGGIVGGVAGIAAVLLAALLFLRWWRRRHRRHSRLGPADDNLTPSAAHASEPTTSSRGMAERAGLLPLALAAGGLVKSRRDRADGEGERGFQRISGRKIPSAFSGDRPGTTLAGSPVPMPAAFANGANAHNRNPDGSGGSGGSRGSSGSGNTNTSFWRNSRGFSGANVVTAPVNNPGPARRATVLQSREDIRASSADPFHGDNPFDTPPESPTVPMLPQGNSANSRFDFGPAFPYSDGRSGTPQGHSRFREDV